ncbi:hypothetical protein J7E81_06145 [Bacillus sp. ISL-18]|nr:hypothetical protein [Bacillus sp. ISL-18]MBT2654831.1 hypothetical protein [Bacillus sp. ISL-18]
MPYNQAAFQEKGQAAIIYKLSGAGHGTEHFWKKNVLDIVRDFFDKYLK